MEPSGTPGVGMAPADRATPPESPFARRKWVAQSSFGTLPPVAVDRARLSSGAPVGPEAQTSPNASELANDAGAHATPSARRSAIVHGLRWTMIGRPASELINLIAAAVLARLVVPAEFGRFTVALVVLGLANVPTQAVNYSLVQRDQLDRDHLRTGMTLTIVLGLVICALIFAASSLDRDADLRRTDGVPGDPDDPGVLPQLGKHGALRDDQSASPVSTLEHHRLHHHGGRLRHRR